MGAWGATIVVVIALALVVAAVVQLRSGPLPFPAIITATVTCAVCYTVAGTAYLGGEAPSLEDGPSIPTVVGSFVGVLALVAMIISLVPRSPEADRDRDRRSPIMIAAAGTLLGAAGLLVHAAT